MIENLNLTNVENYLIKNFEFLKFYLSKYGVLDIIYKDGSYFEFLFSEKIISLRIINLLLV